MMVPSTFRWEWSVPDGGPCADSVGASAKAAPLAALGLPYDSFPGVARPSLSIMPMGLAGKVACRAVERGHEFDLPAGLLSPGAAKIVWRERSAPAGPTVGPPCPTVQAVILCDSLPADLRFPFTLGLPAGSRMLYQSPLTAVDIKRGDTRDPWADYSYALKDARFGVKLGHFSRPWLEDRDGRFAWGKLQWDAKAGVLTKVFRPVDVAGLVGPFAVDLTFGRTDAGGTNSQMASGSVYAFQPDTDPASDGTVDSITAWLTYSSADKVTYGIYDHDAGGPNNLLANGATPEITGTAGATPVAETANYSSKPNITASTQYYLGGWMGPSGSVYIQYDADSKTGYYIDGQTYSAGTMPDPFPDAPSSSAAKSWSIYATYTASGGGSSIAAIQHAYRKRRVG